MSDNKELFFKDKPLFGLDIGYGSLKVMQVDTLGKKQRVIGYGAVTFDPAAINNGVIVNPEPVAQSAHELFSKNLIGHITTSRVVMSVPAARSYSRNVVLPKLQPKELHDVVASEVEQYVPVPPTDLYVDFSIIKETADSIELLIVAVP